MERDYDIIVFGASGFTGKIIVETLRKGVGGEKVRFGVCGRNEVKLRDMFPEEDVFVAEVTSESVMVEVFRRTKVVINATGPYRFYGLPVMEACLKAGTHYVDVCGEPAILELAVLEFDARYKAANLVAIGSCGFDSVPADIGTAFITTLFPSSKFINLVSSYHIVHNSAGIHATTFEAAVHSFANAKELSTIRKSLPGAGTKLPYSGPKRPIQSGSHTTPDGLLAVPFPGADASVVRRTQTGLYLEEDETPVQYHAYLVLNSRLYLIGAAVLMTIMSFLTRFSWGRDLLLSHPQLMTLGTFTTQGPEADVMDKATFELRLVAEGWYALEEVEEGRPISRRVVAKMAGGEPFYRFTAIACIACAMSIVEERTSIPEQGGVFTPWMALKRTTIFDRLRNAGIQIEAVSDESL